jgi:hypothetical protein
MARAVAVVEPFRHRHATGAGDARGQQRCRIELTQWDVPDDLQFALVVVVIGHLQALDV